MIEHTNSSNRAMFVNTYARVLSDRGLAIPQDFKEVLAKRGDDRSVVVAKGYRSHHLACFATTDTAEIDEHVKHLTTPHADNAAVEPFLVTLTIDERGRIKLPEEFMRYAELTVGAKVSVIGCMDWFEIWLPANLERAMAKSTVVDKIGSNGSGSDVLPFLGF